MADVSGKGIPAALIMTMLSGILNMEARANQDPATAITRLNSGLMAKVTGNIFATVFYAVLDVMNNSMEMVSAGHHEILVYRAKNAAVEAYCPRGAAIGIMQGAEFEARLKKEGIQAGPGDKLLLFTDGISEARAGTGKRFGMDRVTESLKKNGGKSCKDAVKGLLADVEAFTGGQEQSDDIAVLIIGREG
jgi:sigma-B regulation protein RsbU (phosphoserine phosphatase)